MQNESCKHYVCLNRPDYTCYMDEEEILLQAGLFAKVENVREDEYMLEGVKQRATVFELYITEKIIESKKFWDDFFVYSFLFAFSLH